MKSVSDLQRSSERTTTRFLAKALMVASCLGWGGSGGLSDTDFEDTASSTHFRQELGFRLTEFHWKEVHCLVTGPDQSVYAIGSNQVGRWEVSDEFEARAKSSPFESVVVEDFWDWKESQRSESESANQIPWPFLGNDRSDWTVRMVDLPFAVDDLVGVFWPENEEACFYGEFGVWKLSQSDVGSDVEWKLIWAECPVTQVAKLPGGDLALATDQGLRKWNGQEWIQFWPVDSLGRKWVDHSASGICVDGMNRLWIASPAGWARQGADLQKDNWRFFTGADGLPYAVGKTLVAGQDGSIWFGSELGWVRYDSTLEDRPHENPWSYRQGKRWGPADPDQITSLAVDVRGNALALFKENQKNAGLGVIARVPMTFREKAKFYELEVDRYIKRTPFGYTSETRLAEPGDRSHVTYDDSDNDGLWTAMYGASQAFAYAAIGDEVAEKNARQVFEALRFLQQAPVGSSHQPPKGYVARTIRPVEWPDPNVGRLEQDREARENSEYLWKVYEPRWPLTADGRWYWKSDTSSDELDGHYFFYPLYYDFVAKDEVERERVREVVRGLTDHLLDNGFQLVDHDGTVTRWGIYDPESLNHDLNWWSERGLKSLSMLSYLTVAEHVTGDSKYAEARRYLIDEHGYDTNAMVAKIQMGVGAGNQSDDEMAVMCYYNLLRYSKDMELREKIQYSFYQYWTYLQPERNPFFHFAYAAHGVGSTFRNPWGTHSLDPWNGWKSDSMQALKGFSLDRVDWATRNNHRLDVVGLSPQQSVDNYDPEFYSGEPRRGHRVDGKVLPVAERHFNHWNTDPWTLNYGGEGRTLASGTVYLLPYYMGVYHGWIPAEKD